ncbi:unnamed protein product [Callosobruchus maculatus]|uniref:SPT2 homolog N-terminal domain-containing protein n=1 Tax=Callosobruchus maculatus TaxID=64391 RepID=A0A653BG62_CALMS|nr:unnamed protein product [Callosobruchus maculatus]
MTTATNQKIEGRKVFHPLNPEGIRFKSLKIKGLINDTDIMELVKNQASRNDDNVFTSEVNFTDVLKAKNVNFDKLYKGVNISELVANITKLGSLDHISDYYWNLLKRSEKIEESLKSQAFYLDHYKQILHHYEPIKILASTFHEREAIISYHCGNFTNIATFLEWDDKAETFVQKEDYTLKLGPPLAYISSVQYFGNDYIYMENEDVHRHLDADHTHIGNLLHFENATQFHSTPFLTRGTLFLDSFFLSDTQEYCLLFIDYNLTTSILCSQKHSEFYVRQLIVHEKAHMASNLNINNCTYLITISSSSNEAFNGSRTAIWKMNGANFEVYQSIYRGNPISVSSVSYNQKHFLAVAYLRFEETMYFGMIEIFKFDGASQKFATYQIIQLATPVQVYFSVLPSNELVLYVVTEDTGAEAFNVYIYEGLFGFSAKVKQSILSRITGIDQFSINDKHFVVAKYTDTIVKWKMDFGQVLHTAKKNEKATSSNGVRYYSTKFEPPKKESKKPNLLSENIKKFLARKEEEEKAKAEEERKRKEELLALRSQDKKATRRVNVMLKRTKSANQSVIDDAVDNDNTAVTLAGPMQPDEDDYGMDLLPSEAYPANIGRGSRYFCTEPEGSSFCKKSQK